MSTLPRAGDWAVPVVTARPGPGAPDLVHRFRAMATDVNLRVVAPTGTAVTDVQRAEAVFHRVERACTRFDPDSPLMRANAAPDEWHEVPRECLLAVTEAARAHLETDGLFDPRVHDTLRAYGYDRTLPFEDEHVRVSPTGHGPAFPPAASGAWRPEIDAATSSVRLGAVPVDLGGIGKGLAVRWAAAQLAGSGSAVLVEAGGDCYLGGAGPDGSGWSVGVEDPAGGTEPVAVLGLTDRAAATSSVRVRQWFVDGERVHHLVDPRTGRPGGRGLSAVTVVERDAAHAEVWSKVLFLAGADGIRDEAERRGVAALWVTEDGALGRSDAAGPYLVWERS